MAGYDFAQICRNGHLVTSFATLLRESTAKFCRQCGEATIMACEQCNTRIRGSRTGQYRYSIPRYCHECGHPYPWTTRTIEAALELARQSSELTDEDNKTLEEDLTDVVRQTPRSQVAAGRFRQVMTKAGKTTAEGVKNIVTDILSETMKKAIWGP